MNLYHSLFPRTNSPHVPITVLVPLPPAGGGTSPHLRGSIPESPPASTITPPLDTHRYVASGLEELDRREVRDVEGRLSSLSAPTPTQKST